MKTICLYFQVHQPFRLKRYRFFDIGSDHYYYDDYSNESILRKVAEKCYLPANKLIMDLIRKYEGNFKVSFSFSGMVLDQFELYGTDVLESFKELAKSDSVEILAESHAHSLAVFKSIPEFKRQVKMHEDLLNKHFGLKPGVFRNTELIYSDEIGNEVAKMGYTGMLTEGAKHVLGWKSPNHLYCNALNPKLKILTRNFKLSDDIAFRFSNESWNEWPLTAEKYVSWLEDIPEDEEIVNLFMDYETFGEHQWEETGIFSFLENFVDTVIKKPELNFGTPSDVIRQHQVVAPIHVPNPISWADEEKDLTAWLGNELQEEAFNKLYSLEELVVKIDNADIKRDWTYLQASDHFYYMCTKFFSDGEVHAYFSPFDSPYDAFINYMNILSDFILRVKAFSPTQTKETEDLNILVSAREKEIKKLKDQINRLKKSKETTAPKRPKPKTVATGSRSARKGRSKEPLKSKTTARKQSRTQQKRSK
ncbi:MAG: glycoside hydrolase family 57 protein [Bacteroidota bacterium]|nr:glycoside hydrolase family 57 protein [Bacteroidota bacterium]